MNQFYCPKCNIILSVLKNSVSIIYRLRHFDILCPKCNTRYNGVLFNLTIISNNIRFFETVEFKDYNKFIEILSIFINQYSNRLSNTLKYLPSRFPKEFQTPEVELILKLL